MLMAQTVGTISSSVNLFGMTVAYRQPFFSSERDYVVRVRVPFQVAVFSIGCGHHPNLLVGITEYE